MSDSRCPVDVTCVWAGEVTVAFILQLSGREERFELSTNAPSANAQELHFELLDVAPAPRSTTTIAPADYRISLRATPATPATLAPTAPAGTSR